MDRWQTLHSLVTAAAVTLVVAPARAQPLDLGEALERARTQNLTLRAARAELDAARGRFSQAGLWPANPIISGQLARHTGPGEETIDREIALGQEVEVGGQRGLRVAAARHDVERAEQLLGDRQRAVEAEVRRTFAEVVAAERRKALAAEGAALADRLAEAARRRVRAGELTGIDLRLAEVEAARTAQALGLAESAQVAALAHLGTAIGAGPDESLSVVAREDEAAAPGAEADLVAQALASRPDLAAARAERARLTTEADLVRRQGTVPNPVVRGFYRQELGQERIVGGEVAVPLPVWNRSQGAEIAARASATAAAVEVERLERDIPRQVRLALTRRAVAMTAWERYRRDALPAASAARALLERAYENGYLGLPEVLVQQDRLLAVRDAAIGAWLDLHTADADLIEAVGGALP